MYRAISPLIALALFSLTALPVFAQGGGQFVPLLPDLPIVNDGSNLATFVNGVFKLTVGIAAILAVIMIVIGGFRYMMTESPFTMGDAKGQIADALIGLLIVLASILILRTINPDLVQLNVFRNAQQGTPPAQNPVPTGSGNLQINIPMRPDGSCPAGFTPSGFVCTSSTAQQSGAAPGAAPQTPGTPPNPQQAGNVANPPGGQLPSAPLTPPGQTGNDTQNGSGDSSNSPQVPSTPPSPPTGSSVFGSPSA